MYLFGLYYDSWYFILVVPAMLIALFAQLRVKTTFSKYSTFINHSGLTAADAAQRVLTQNGVTGVRIVPVQGSLTDNYNPKNNTISLSEDVYGSSSVAALGVACHEAGHAVQHKKGVLSVKIRTALVPVANIGSTLSWPLILIGFIMGYQPLVILGILLFSLVTLFMLVTLPVEFDASRRAISALRDTSLSEAEVRGARSVLTAAAMTYVAALAVSLANLLRLILRFSRNNR